KSIAEMGHFTRCLRSSEDIFGGLALPCSLALPSNPPNYAIYADQRKRATGKQTPGSIRTLHSRHHATHRIYSPRSHSGNAPWNDLWRFLAVSRPQGGPYRQCFYT